MSLWQDGLWDPGLWNALLWGDAVPSTPADNGPSSAGGGQKTPAEYRRLQKIIRRRLLTRNAVVVVAAVGSNSHSAFAFSRTGTASYIASV